MKRIVVRIIVSVVVLMMTLSSCRHDEQIAIPENNHVPEGYVSVCFRVDQSDMKEVNVRSVDPDGQDINTMKLFCFNAYGLFLATTTAELTRGAEDNAGHHTQGTYKAAIPEETSIIHFVANAALCGFAVIRTINAKASVIAAKTVIISFVCS